MNGIYSSHVSELGIINYWNNPVTNRVAMKVISVTAVSDSVRNTPQRARVACPLCREQGHTLLMSLPSLQCSHTQHDQRSISHKAKPNAPIICKLNEQIAFMTFILGLEFARNS